jgi:hypothetical protein
VKGLAGPMLSVVRPKLACGVFGGSREKFRVPWLLHKAEHNSLLVWPQNQHEAGTMWRPSHEWDWRGGCTESTRFAAVHHKTVGVNWLNHKTMIGGSADEDGTRARREASKRATRGMIEMLARRPDGCAAVRWRTSCVDQNAPVRVCIVSLSVGALRSFPEGLYIGGGG